MLRREIFLVIFVVLTSSLGHTKQWRRNGGPAGTLLCSDLVPVPKLDTAKLEDTQWAVLESVELFGGVPISWPEEGPDEELDCQLVNIGGVKGDTLEGSALLQQRGHSKLFHVNLNSSEDGSRWTKEVEPPHYPVSDQLVLFANPERYLVLATCATGETLPFGNSFRSKFGLQSGQQFVGMVQILSKLYHTSDGKSSPLLAGEERVRVRAALLRKLKLHEKFGTRKYAIECPLGADFNVET